MHPRIGHMLTWFGWSLAIVSLFLPVSRALVSAGAPIGTPLVGWDALTTIIEHLLSVWFWIYLIADPAGQWILIFPAATFLLLTFPPVVLAANEEAGCLQIPLAIVPLLLVFLPRHVQATLCWGVWVWSAAFVLVAVGGLIRGLAAASQQSDPI